MLNALFSLPLSTGLKTASLHRSSEERVPPPGHLALLRVLKLIPRPHNRQSTQQSDEHGHRAAKATPSARVSKRGEYREGSGESETLAFKLRASWFFKTERGYGSEKRADEKITLSWTNLETYAMTQAET